MSIFKRKRQPLKTQKTIEQYNSLVSEYRYWRQKQYEFRYFHNGAYIVKIRTLNCNYSLMLNEFVCPNSVNALLPIIKDYIKERLTAVRNQLDALCQTYNIEPPDYDKL